jgi:hypothetical protein
MVATGYPRKLFFAFLPSRLTACPLSIDAFQVLLLAAL